ncbi:NnrS family protein [Marinobacterium rhizophilum]|uniref:NnrS family protein n=1 Tax=Marinobacterium rhizophilum TaxID=420402 RepID=UPI00037C9088|nr:NnrS family protein [Marinobacterium rhizophilum]
MIPLQERRVPAEFSLFNLAFRPFFLLAGAAGALLIGLWLYIYTSATISTYYGNGLLWHGHEMLFGFAIAVIAGFLLTAVRTWTSIQTLSGFWLASLALVWLAGRIVPFLPIPAIAVALTDLAFLPLLGMALAWPLVRSRNYRNLVFLALLCGFFIANLLVHLQQLGLTRTALDGLHGALYLVVLMMLIMGGRVIPFFTERGLGTFTAKRRPWLERLIIPLALLWALSWALQWPRTALLTAALNFAAHLVRQSGWLSPRIARVPLLWILHLGYLFMTLGFALQCFSALGWLPASLALHAFGAGAIGSLTLGMMARVSLGHTGRPLEIPGSIRLAFALMLLAGLSRVLLPLASLPYAFAIYTAGSLWVLAWLLFLLHYSRILIRPRVDGLYG